MPIINIRAAIANHTLTGMGQYPPLNKTSCHATVSGTCRVEYKNLNVHVSAVNSRLSFRITNTIDVNGTYLHYRDSKTTITHLDRLRPIAVSGSFGGCAYKIYRGGGSFICAHIARSGGHAVMRGNEEVKIGQDNLVNLMDSYAAQKRWTELLHVTTHGLTTKPDCQQVAVASQIFANRIETVRLELGPMGGFVRNTQFTTQI